MNLTRYGPLLVVYFTIKRKHLCCCLLIFYDFSLPLFLFFFYLLHLITKKIIIFIMTDWFKTLNSPYFSIGSFIFFQQLGKFLHLENYVGPLRILYLTAQISIVALSYLLIHKIRQKNGKYFISMTT